MLTRTAIINVEISKAAMFESRPTQPQALRMTKTCRVLSRVIDHNVSRVTRYTSSAVITR